MKVNAALLVLIPVVASALVASVAAPPSYVLSIVPNTPISQGASVTLTLSITNGPNPPYGVIIVVKKPSNSGMATITKSIDTSGNDRGSVSIPYPDPTWTSVSGTVATDVSGIYNVIANQTGPTNTGTVATGQFTVTSQWSIVITQPSPGAIVQRGQSVTISAAVANSGGPISGALVIVNSPSPPGQIVLPQVSSSSGVYSTSYQVLMNDPLGTWNITAKARDTSGNTGNSSPVAMRIVKSSVYVDSLITYNSKGAPTTQFSPSETIFPYFRIRYSSSSGIFLTTGQYLVSVRSPSGRIAGNLTAVYDPNRLGFYVPTGFTVSTFDPSGSWSIIVGANTIDDGFGNTGPDFTTSVSFDIVTSPLSFWPFVAGAVVAIISGLVVMRRFNQIPQDFGHLEKLMGGPMPRGSSFLFLGDPGSGKTVLCYQILHDELESGRRSALLSYDAFPEDVQSRMGEFGWDIISHLRKGRLKIVDCYSGLAGQGEGSIKDPSDLTELNIQVTAFIAKAKSGPVTVILDSLTPIFNGVDERQAVNFIQALSARVKKTGGLFIMTASKGAIPDNSAAKIKTMVDGVFELIIVRSRSKSHRFLTVLKMERRKISSDSVPFEIERSRGIVFRVSRFGLLKNRLSSWLGKHRKVRAVGPRLRSLNPSAPREAD